MPNVHMLAPQTLTRSEQDALLQAVTQPRDHLIFSLALGTGLRLAEVVGLDVGDVYLNGTPRSRIRLRVTKGGRKGDVILPDALMPKLKSFWSYKRRGGESLDAEAPLFCNQTGQRISKRRVQVAFRSWQIKAGFDLLYPFHALRHTEVTNVYRSSRNLFLAQRFARHVSLALQNVNVTRQVWVTLNVVRIIKLPDLKDHGEGAAIASRSLQHITKC